jgi:hypothetical protein
MYSVPFLDISFQPRTVLLQMEMRCKLWSVFHTKGRTYIEGIREQGAEENIWT